MNPCSSYLWDMGRNALCVRMGVEQKQRGQVPVKYALHLTG